MDTKLEGEKVLVAGPLKTNNLYFFAASINKETGRSVPVHGSTAIKFPFGNRQFIYVF